MALSIRMSRGGAKKRPHYRIVVADSRSPRDGRFIENLGTHDPLLKHDDPKRVVLKEERIKHWLGYGAKPSVRVARFLGSAGIIPKPTYREQPKKSQPRAKTQERMKEAAEAAKKAAEAPAEETAPAEEAAPAEETTLAAEAAPAEESAPAEEAAPAEAPAAEATAAEGPAAEEAAKADGGDEEKPSG